MSVNVNIICNTGKCAGPSMMLSIEDTHGYPDQQMYCNLRDKVKRSFCIQIGAWVAH